MELNEATKAALVYRIDELTQWLEFWNAQRNGIRNIGNATYIMCVKEETKLHRRINRIRRNVRGTK